MKRTSFCYEKNIDCPLGSNSMECGFDFTRRNIFAECVCVEMAVVPRNDCLDGGGYLGGYPNCRVQNEETWPYPYLGNLSGVKSGDGHGLTYVERILNRQMTGVPFFVGNGVFGKVEEGDNVDWMEMYRQSYLRLNNLNYLYGFMLKDAIEKGIKNKRKIEEMAWDCEELGGFGNKIFVERKKGRGIEDEGKKQKEKKNSDEDENGVVFIDFLFALVETFRCQEAEFPCCYMWALWNGIPLKELYRGYVNYLENLDDCFVESGENLWCVEYFEGEVLKFWSKHESRFADKWKLVEKGMKNVSLLQYGKFKVRGYTYYSMDIEEMEKILWQYKDDGLMVMRKHSISGWCGNVDKHKDKRRKKLENFSVHVCCQNPTFVG